ncbi:MAG: hypothetical protein KJ901_23670 [Gammaproteobacteria bacterium]|nr:hypothetical protein [Gammaproteobacteria bacterium]MBU1441609.1 hypothetical protein [Gammaproteobacteria bacterium]
MNSVSERRFEVSTPDDYNEIFTPSRRQELEIARLAEAKRRLDGWKRNLGTVLVICLVCAAIWLMKT